MSNNTVLKKYVSSISEAYKQYESFLERIKPETNEELFLAKTELLAFCKSKKIDAILTDTNNLLEESHEGLERVKNIVMDLKTYSHAGTANLEEVNIIDSIESCLKIINNEIRYKCTVKKNWSKLPVLWGYPSQLHQVFLNILVNAAQSITEKGEISITIESNNDEIIVIIKDTGEGISPEHLEKLFEPFFTTKAVGVGTGLGLSISNNIIKKHKGTIEVESCVGKGTAFKISLPINGLKNSTGMNHAQQK